MRRFIAVALMGPAVAACDNTETDTFDVPAAAVVEGLPAPNAVAQGARMVVEEEGGQMHSSLIVDGERVHVHTADIIDTSDDAGCLPEGATCSVWRGPMWAEYGGVVAFALPGESNLNLLANGNLREIPLGEVIERVGVDGRGFLVNGRSVPEAR